MLAFTGCRLDRADHIRADPEALAAQMGWRARLLALDGLLPVIDDAGALAWGSLADAPPDAELVFLGLDDDRETNQNAGTFYDESPSDANEGADILVQTERSDDQRAGRQRVMAAWHPSPHTRRQRLKRVRGLRGRMVTR